MRPPELAAREQAFHDAERAALAEAQARGQIATVPLDDLLLTANSAIMGLAPAIVEGRLGPVDAARATDGDRQLDVLGHGFAPRAQPLPRRSAATGRGC